MTTTSPEVLALLEAIAHAAHNYKLAWRTATWQRHEDVEGQVLGDLEDLEDTLQAYRAYIARPEIQQARDADLPSLEEVRGIFKRES